MTTPSLPHPLPYQGSKRKLAPLIGQFVQGEYDSWYEPFAGSIAMTIWAASRNLADRYVVGDSLEPICELWREIILNPQLVASRYKEVWEAQRLGGEGYFNHVRERYNSTHDPIDLLYLICRCVKNSVRFNRHGAFTQSADRRRLGMRPDKMELAVRSVSLLLKGRTEVVSGDWTHTVREAGPDDYVYLDPPYLGTSTGRDKRYAHQMERETLIRGLRKLIAKRVPFALSYDGMTGGREYGPALPGELGMTRLLLHAGLSSQATLNGRTEDTIESLYVWPELTEHDGEIIRHEAKAQESPAFRENVLDEFR